MRKICLLALTSCFLSNVYADETHSFVISSDDDTGITFYDGGIDTTLYTLNDPTNGFKFVCKGRDSGYYLETADQKHAYEYEIPVRGPYGGDHRDSCDDFVEPISGSDPGTNLIQSVYWIANFPYVYYMENGTFNGCYLLNDISKQTVNETGKDVYTISALSNTYFKGDAGMSTEKAFIVGMDAGGNAAAQGTTDQEYYFCDPRETTLTGFDISSPRYTTYNIELHNHADVNQSAEGIKLIKPGSAKYPAYQFQVENKTDDTITLKAGTQGQVTGTYYAYCQNPTGWQTADYVFQEALSYITAVQGDDDNNLQDVIESAHDAGKALKPILEASCPDKLAPVIVPMVDKDDNLKPIAAGDTLTIGDGYEELVNFDNFLDVSVSFNDGTKDYQYALAPASNYTPLTFNSGFHVVKVVISKASSGGYQVDLYSTPNIGVDIHNELNLVENGNSNEQKKEDENALEKK